MLLNPGDTHTYMRYRIRRCFAYLVTSGGSFRFISFTKRDSFQLSNYFFILSFFFFTISLEFTTPRLDASDCQILYFYVDLISFFFSRLFISRIRDWKWCWRKLNRVKCFTFIKIGMTLSRNSLSVSITPFEQMFRHHSFLMEF